VIVDRYQKYAHFLPMSHPGQWCSSTVPWPYLEIAGPTFDQGTDPIWTSKFWKSLMVGSNCTLVQHITPRVNQCNDQLLSLRACGPDPRVRVYGRYLTSSLLLF
jgi:hypothetical protein